MFVLYRVGVLLLAISLALLVGLWLRHNRPVTLPAPTGPYAVGRVTYDWRDDAREETLVDSPGSKRELMVSLWYPVAPAQAKGTVAPYWPENWRLARQKAQGVLAHVLLQNPATVHAHALENAPLAPDQATYPLLLFQPGLGPVVYDYTAILEDLASQGYIVVASTPTYSANVVVFADGRVAEGTAQGNVADNATLDEAKTRLAQLVQIWAADDAFVLDQVEKLNQSDPLGRFTGRIALQKVGVFGHSFGGASAIQFCSQDRRCRAGADLDGYPYGNIDQLTLPQPFLILWSEPPKPPDALWQYAMQATQTIFAHANQDKYQFTLPGTGHFNFSDLPLYFNPVVQFSGGFGTIAPERATATTSGYLKAFFDRYLRGIATSLLNGKSAL